MDISTLISTLVGGVCTLIGAFGAIYLTSRLDRKKAAKTKYLEKIEAIGAYMPQLKRWYREESAMYWDGVEEECVYDPRPNKYDCPFYEIENLVNWWLPSLQEHVQAIGTVVSYFEYLRDYEGAREYTPRGNMEHLRGELRSHANTFHEHYEYIWSAIGAEAKKAVS